jgi:hypothetical protein
MPNDRNAEFWFKSSLFDIEPGEDERTSSYGKQLAHWLRAKLAARGYGAAEVIPEDWGWCVMCARKPFLLWVGCAGVHDRDRTGPHAPPPDSIDVTWHCFVVAEQPFLARLFRRADTGAGAQELARQVIGILKAHPEIILTERP